MLPLFFSVEYAALRDDVQGFEWIPDQFRASATCRRKSEARLGTRHAEATSETPPNRTGPAPTVAISALRGQAAGRLLPTMHARQIALRCRMALTSAAVQPSHSP